MRRVPANAGVQPRPALRANAAAGAREILVYGRAPEDAAQPRLTADGRAPVEAEPFEGPPGAGGDFYLIAVPPGLENGRVNWVDEMGDEGTRGIELLPP